MKSKLIAFLVIASFIFVVGCGKKENKMKKDQKVQPSTSAQAAGPIIKDYENLDVIKNQLDKYFPVDIPYDASKLTDKEKKALFMMVRASQLMDSIFSRQVYSKNGILKKELKAWYEKNPEFKYLLKYFTLNAGPFDRLDNHKSFINLSVPKPLGANFYPEDMTKQEFEDYIKANPEKEKEFVSPYTVIRRENGKLFPLAYSLYYDKPLAKAAKLLKKAADQIDNPSLKKYLLSRADAFLSNDYYQSDLDWMDLKDHKIEFVIGPYEVYEDRLFGYKASFEAFVTLVDQQESQKMAKVSKNMLEMEKNLPIEDKYKNFKRGSSAPILIVNEVYASGDTRAGVQTTAFNLPNDERVREAKGSKQVMLKNISQAKFENSFMPIAKEVVAKSDLPSVSFDAYFNFVLMHEISHGLGPGNIVKNGKNTNVNKELKELYSTIEEAKADVLGMYNAQFLIGKGILAKKIEKELYPSYLAGFFRSIRFGIDEAHGGATAIQFNYIVEKQGFSYDPKTGRFSVNNAKIKDVIKQLGKELLEIQATGDYDRAKKFIDKYRFVSKDVKQALDRVANVPTDIRQKFLIEADIKEADAKAKKAK